MGIPQCGGLHAVASEHLCLECLHLGLRKAEVLALNNINDLLEESLDLEYRGERRPRRSAPPPPPPPPPTPRTAYGQRGGMTIEPR